MPCGQWPGYTPHLPEWIRDGSEDVQEVSELRHPARPGSWPTEAKVENFAQNLKRHAQALPPVPHVHWFHQCQRNLHQRGGDEDHFSIPASCDSHKKGCCRS